MKKSLLIISSLLMSTPAVKAAFALNDGANSAPDITVMAAQIADQTPLLVMLEEISGQDTLQLLGKSEFVCSVLSILDKSELETMAAAIQNFSKHNSPRMENASVQRPAPAQEDQHEPDASRLLTGRVQFNIEGINVALFNVAPLGDCGLLSLPGNITRQEAVGLVEQAILTPGKLHPDDVAYLKDQHYHLTTEGQSLQQRHLKLIGYLLGYDISFYSDVGGMLIEDSEIKIATKPSTRLQPIYIYDGEGHFQALIPTNDPVALQHAMDKETQRKQQTAAYAKRYQ